MNNDTKFTPGPWEFDVEIHWVNQPGEQEVHGAWDVYPVDDCDHIIATVNHVYPDRNTCRYNARLIAAAPEMYEALNGISSLFGPNTPFVLTKLHGLMTNGDQDKIDAVFGKIMHALAKAVRP